VLGGRHSVAADQLGVEHGIRLSWVAGVTDHPAGHTRSATGHDPPTRSFAIPQAAEYDAVVSITHVDQPYLFTVPASRDARPDAAADQAAHDVLTSLYPAAKSSLDQLLATELSAIPNSQRKRDGIRVGATVAQLLIGLRAADGFAATPPPFTAGT